MDFRAETSPMSLRLFNRSKAGRSSGMKFLQAVPWFDLATAMTRQPTINIAGVMAVSGGVV
jgi:hypothetical protein